MSRWGSQREEESSTIDIETLLNQKKSAVELIQTQQFMDEVKGNSTKFTQLIIQPNYRSILFDIIDIALNPNLYKLSHNQPLNTQLTHNAIQILSNLSEEFVINVFGEDVKTQDQVIQNPTDSPILQYIFRILFQQDAQETSLAYLVKLITPFIYQRAEKMLVILNGEISKGLVNYFWSKSICQLVGKALQAEGQHDFYQSLKLSLVKTICESIYVEQNELRMEGLIQSFAEFLEGLVEKHEDKYQKSKFSSLIKNIVAQAQNFDFLINLLQKYPENHRIKTDTLHCLEAYLRIHLPIKQQQGSKVSNQSNSEVNKAIRVSESFLNSLKCAFQKIHIRNFISQVRLQIVYYYKLVKILITVEPQLTKFILTKEFLIQTLKIMLNDPDNNILHNYQKDVLVQGVKQSTQVYQLLKDEIGLHLILRDNLTDEISKKGFESQLFLIGEAIELKTKENQSFSNSWSDIEETIKHKRQFYSTLIGGDPRNCNEDRWSNYEGEIMQCKEQVVQVNYHNELLSSKVPFSCTPKLDELGGTEVLSEEGDILDEQGEKKNDHYFDLQLPLDSDKEEDKFVSKESLEFSSSQNIIIRINSINQDFQSNPLLSLEPTVPIQEESDDGKLQKQNEKQELFISLVIEEDQKPQQQKQKLYVSEEIEFIEIASPTYLHSIPNEQFGHKIQQKQSLVQILFSSQAQSLSFEGSGKLQQNFDEQIGNQKLKSSNMSQEVKKSTKSSNLQKMVTSARDEVEIRISVNYDLPLRNK